VNPTAAASSSLRRTARLGAWQGERRPLGQLGHAGLSRIG
jgi:hypothetical protein